VKGATQTVKLQIFVYFVRLCACGVNALYKISRRFKCGAAIEGQTKGRSRMSRDNLVDVDGQLKVSPVRWYEWTSESAFVALILQVDIRSLNCRHRRVLNCTKYN